ncbi:hypothetical protein [Psychromonas sp. SR45-3]|uniref:hypothetical protein n=1 Tax=Psychromonas sp. SR45-3 TaxID=2760930 RepID=UPI0015F83624|nr:hypothetical protein [Psychromonas sp. SR45-3]MBB1272517.1 hypothetical protein [Psychromonas sp. SR45-3]
MKLNKRLYINNQDAKLAEHRVSLKLSLGSVAIFTLSDELVIEKNQAVRFDIGYQQNMKPFFEGYIEKIQPAENGHIKITAKENTGILSHRWPVSAEHPTMRDVLALLSDKTGLEFVLPKDADYTDRKIPNFVCQGTGYQCLQQIGRAFEINDLVWFQHTDQTVHISSYQDCRFYNKPVNIPLDLSSRLKGDNMTFAPFPMLRPGALIKDDKLTEKRIIRLDLMGDEMTAYWETDKNSVPAKKREILNYFPELATANHLPKLGRVEAVRDNAQAGQTADPFRPRYSVDVQLLDENLNADTNVPVYRSIPMPNTMAGSESGLLAYPLEGTFVEIAFAYGRNDLPILRGVYGRDYALPSIAPGEQLQQQRDAVSQRIDAAGNNTEQTDQTQTKRAFEQHDQADNYQGEFGKHRLIVDEHSIEEIVGKKVIEALGAIDLLSGDDLVLGSLGNMQVSTAGELITTVGKLRTTIITLDDKLKVLQNRIQTIEKDDTLTVNGKQTIAITKDQIITAKNITQDADTIKLNGGTGVITCQSICPFTGKPHVDGSTTVFAGK